MSDNNDLQQRLEAELAKMEPSNTEETKSVSSEIEHTEETVSERETVETSESQYTETEKQAMEQGWNPNHNGPNKKSAEQFLRDGSFFKKIDEQKKEISELKSLVKQQLDHNKKIEQASYEKALKDLQAAKYKAVQEGDIDAYNHIENQTKIVQEQLNQNAPQQPVQNGKSAELTNFLETNKNWFNLETPENRRMAAMANSIFQIEVEEANRFGYQVNEAELLKKVEKEIKETFKHRFENTNQKKPSLVTNSTTSGSTGSSIEYKGLTKQQQELIKRVKKIDPTFKTEDYIKQLKLTGDYNE